MKKYLVLLMIMVCSLLASASVSINVTQPASGNAAVTSPVQFEATASSTKAAVTGWIIYLNNDIAAKGTGSRISASVPTPAGYHRAIIRVWDATGDHASSYFDLKVESGGVTVSLAAPTGGDTSALVQVTASASPSPTYVITGWAVYVDNNLVHQAGAYATINASLTLTQGPHTVIVRAWDSSGKYGDQARTVNVTTGEQSTGGYRYVLKELEEKALLSCGTCGNHIGDARYVWGTQTWVGDPSINGKAAKFSIGGDNKYTNYYWYWKDWTRRKFTRSKTVFRLWVPRQYANTPQAIEWETQHRVDNHVYNLSGQLLYKDYKPRWRRFDWAAKRWVDVGIPFKPLTPDTWHTIEADWILDHSAKTLTLVAYWLDGQKLVPTQNVTMPGIYDVGVDYSNPIAFQLDMDGSATDYHVFVDGFEFHYE